MKKFQLLIISLIIILVLGCTVIGILYFTTDIFKTESNKESFNKYIAQMNLKEFINLEEYNTNLQRMQDEKLDFLNVAREHQDPKAYRAGHQWGNRLLTGTVRFFFGDKIKDLLSGYKIFSRRFVKTFPARSNGFEIETELTVFALSCRLPLAEEKGTYYPRPEGSHSKLSTYKDGIKILRTIFLLIKEERPFLFCIIIACLLAALSLGIATPVFITFAKTGLVPRLPSAVLATGLMIWALLFFISGLILDNVRQSVQEMRRIAYLRQTPRKYPSLLFLF